MSKEQKNIDELFKDRLLNRQFEFNAAAWKGAESLLDKHGTKAGGFWRRGMYGLMALLFMSGVSYIGYNTLNDEGNAVALTTDQVQEQPQQPSTTMGSAQSAPKQTPTNTDADINEAINKDNTTNSTKIAGNQQNTLPGQGKSSTPNVNIAASNDDVTQGNRQLESSSNISAGVTTPTVAGINSSKNIAQPQSLTQSNKPKSNSRRSNTSPIQQVAPRSDVLTTGSTQNSQTAQGSESNTTPMAFASSDEQSILEFVRMEALIPDLEVDHDKNIIKSKSDLLKKDKKPWQSTYLTSWGAIAGYGPGFESVDISKSPARAFIGLRYMYSLNKRFSVHGNLLYSRVMNLDVPVEFESNEFDFGFNSTKTVITTKSLSSFDLPVYVNYYFAHRHNIYAGTQLSFIHRVLTDKLEDNENSFDQSQAELKDNTEYVDHIHRLQISAVMGYEYLINERFSVGLRYQHRLNNDVKKKFLSNSNYRMNSVAFTLGFNFGR